MVRREVALQMHVVYWRHGPAGMITDSADRTGPTEEPGPTVLADLLRRLEELEAREEIRGVLQRNARGMDRADAETTRSTYHDDSFEIHWETFTGNGHEFADYITRQIASTVHVAHLVSDPLIELDGDRAFCESRYTARTRVERDTDIGSGYADNIVWGRYLDVLERRDGRWAIAHRRLVREGGRTDVVAGPARSQIEGSVAGFGDDDPSSRGFAVVEDRPAPTRGPDDLFGPLRRYGT